MQVKKTVVDQIIKEEVVKLSKVIVLNEEKQNILKQLRMYRKNISSLFWMLPHLKCKESVRTLLKSMRDKAFTVLLRGEILR